MDDVAEIALSSAGAVLDSQVVLLKPCATVPCESASEPPLPPPAVVPPPLPSVEVPCELPPVSAAIAALASSDSEMPLVSVDARGVSDSLVGLEDPWLRVPCSKPSSIGGTTRFAQWIRSLEPKELADIVGSVSSWKEAELAWLRSQGKKTPMLFQLKREHRLTKLATRLAKGCEYSTWLEGRGSKSKAPLRDFLRETRVEFKSFVPKRDKQYLARCLQAWREHEQKNAGHGAYLPRARKAPCHRQRLPEHCLSRRRGAGPSFKSPELRELLWDWFVDVRGSIASIITPKLVIFKAKEIAESILRAQRLTGCYAPLPELNRMWLLRWKRDKGVVLRKPNARFKCGKEVLCKRLRAMWINVIKVRHLASRFLDNDLGTRIFGVDEKPLHMNEGGSKVIGTLEVAGAPSVALKQNHAQTRERVSLMTSVTSCPDIGASATLMPLELLCKGKTNKRIASLRVPQGMRVSLQCSEKGSYRGENIVAYLERWLDPWTELRAQRGDWRSLLMDVAKKPHRG